MQLSPAREVLESILVPDADVDRTSRNDPDYLAHLARSYQELEKMEAWNDFLVSVKMMENRLVDEWTRGVRGAEGHKTAVFVLRAIPKIPQFALRRWKADRQRAGQETMEKALDGPVLQGFGR